jgi:hypothetical protein
MPLQNYQSSRLSFNTNFLEQTSTPGTYGYRGELVLVEGEVADAKGHVKPPVEVMRGVAILADEKLKLVIGAIDRLELLQTIVDKYMADFAPDMKAVLYVVDIKEPVIVEIEGISFVLIPLLQGVPWNETTDELGLEKSDFKGQSAADKIDTMLSELGDYRPKYPKVSLADALASTTDLVREGWGAV